MIARHLTNYLLDAVSKYPVIALTGPRQSGKTTLVKKIFPKKGYVSLEDIDHREFALNDPRGFLNQHEGGLIIDEAQYAPSLFSYIQTRVDQNKKPGEFILTGSQNFLLLEKISQSLAGRAAISHLLPLTYQELKTSPCDFKDVSELLFKGGYPRIYDQDLNPTDWYKNYVRTYVERDVRQIKNISDLSKFQLFIKLCAGRIGQLLNLSSLATEVGVDQRTIRSWLSVLEASFLIFLLKPHHQNFNKRLVKQPKLYFCDTGLACYLLGIEKNEEVSTHYARGSLFENFIITELLKKRLNQGKDPNLYFWRDNHGHEVDIILSQGNKLIPVEVKSGATITPDFLKNITYWTGLSGEGQAYLIYGGELNQKRSAVTILSWKDMDEMGG
jgi:uncharacterized protein